jgi:hypothetical protein
MRRLVSPPVIYSAVGLYLVGVGHEVGSAYGLPSDAWTILLRSRLLEPPVASLPLLTNGLR